MLAEQIAVAAVKSQPNGKTIKSVQKRDGSVAPFTMGRISSAVFKAMKACNEGSEEEADFIAKKVRSELLKIAKISKDFTPSVEGIQDIVERELIHEGYAATAKHYILYREERAKIRAAAKAVPDHVRKLVEESKKYFRNSLSEFVYYRTYSRWIEAENRRETWIETVQRYMEFMKNKLGDKLSEAEYWELEEAILRMEVMPSMRLMWSAGKAAGQSNVCAYNCSYIAPTTIRDFGEILYLLCCGTGVGFSVESENVQQLPLVKNQIPAPAVHYVIEDSKEGWADAVINGMETWFDGRDAKFDYSKIRPAGARLNTMGGKASGPGPLQAVLDFTRQVILKRQGRRLTNLDAHDIICKIGECVVSGGVRRSALISLSDLDDDRLRHAKEGHFYMDNPQRSLANNSAVYRKKPTDEEFLAEWLALIKSRSGERGIFNREGLTRQVPLRRLENWEQHGHALNIPHGHATIEHRLLAQVGTNPCGEINLLSKQFCNLTETVCRAGDDVQTLRRKVRLATILGTYQSTLTDFPYLSKEWKENCERERLLGVSLTGMWDCETIRYQSLLENLKELAVEVNKEYAGRFGIPASTAITCIKPSGTVSQLVDASSGMHPRHAQYYIRRVRINATESLFQMLKDQKVPYFPEVGQTYDTATTFVFEFPVKAPEGSVYKDDLTAQQQLDFWKLVKTSYTEHNPSITVSVSDNEWMSTANWVWENWDIVGGLSFLPRNDTVYQLAPYEEISEEKYLEMMKKFEGIDYSKIVTYEKNDETVGSKELACAGGVCEIT